MAQIHNDTVTRASRLSEEMAPKCAQRSGNATTIALNMLREQSGSAAHHVRSLCIDIMIDSS